MASIMYFAQSLTRLVLFILACQILASPFLTSSFSKSDELSIACIDYDFQDFNLVKDQEEKESKELISNLAPASLLNIYEHIRNLSRLHSHSFFDPLQTVISRTFLFRALLI